MQGYIKENFDVILTVLILLAFQGITYLLIQHTKRPLHDMSRPFDARIPLKPQFIFIYVMWYPMIGIFPLVLHTYAPQWFTPYLISILTDIFISLAVYWFYPTAFKRPEPPRDTISGKALGIMYFIDYRGMNCMPSMHCSMCYIIMMYAILGAGIPAGMQALFCALSALIVMATLFTKQHVIIDAITALPLAVACCIAGCWIG